MLVLNKVAIPLHFRSKEQFTSSLLSAVQAHGGNKGVEIFDTAAYSLTTGYHTYFGGHPTSLSRAQRCLDGIERITQK